MHTNVGTTDRIIRLALALVGAVVFLFVPAPIRWVGAVGLIPLVTAFAGWCPLYSLLGINTCGVKT